MPRRTYGPHRRRPTSHEGGLLRDLEKALTRRPAGPLSFKQPLTHRAFCATPDVGTFTGNRGDHMARCRTCGATSFAPTNPQERDNA